MIKIGFELLYHSYIRRTEGNVPLLRNILTYFAFSCKAQHIKFFNYLEKTSKVPPTEKLLSKPVLGGKKCCKQ